MEGAFFQDNQPIRIVADRLRGIVAYESVSLQRLQQEKASRLESLVNLLKHFLILLLVLQVAKGGKNVEDRIKLEVKWNSPHVAMHPPYLDLLCVGLYLCLLEKDFAQIFTSHLVAALGKRNGMASMTATQIKDAATRCHRQKRNNAINFSRCSFRRTNRSILTSLSCTAI